MQPARQRYRTTLIERVVNEMNRWMKRRIERLRARCKENRPQKLGSSRQ
jgi:hypothetical protein